jgi:hypothetical protein
VTVFPEQAARLFDSILLRGLHCRSCRALEVFESCNF